MGLLKQNQNDTAKRPLDTQIPPSTVRRTYSIETTRRVDALPGRQELLLPNIDAYQSELYVCQATSLPLCEGKEGEELFQGKEKE